jgi:hypothetical protein
LKFVTLPIAALSLLIVGGGCDNHVHVPASTSRNAVLTVTWQVRGQPPQTTQTVLSNVSGCEAARLKAIDAGDEARAAREEQNARDKADAQASIQRAIARAKALGGGSFSDISPDEMRKLQGEPLPHVSAYCSEQ